MSQQELEQTDKEVMEMVNSKANPKAKRRADQIEDALKGQTPEELAEQYYKECSRKQKIRAILCVVACLLIAVALLIVLFVHDLLVWVVNIGVLCCGIVAGIAIDRQCRYRLL